MIKNQLVLNQNIETKTSQSVFYSITLKNRINTQQGHVVVFVQRKENEEEKEGGRFS